MPAGSSYSFPSNVAFNPGAFDMPSLTPNIDLSDPVGSVRSQPFWSLEGLNSLLSGATDLIRGIRGDIVPPRSMAGSRLSEYLGGENQESYLARLLKESDDRITQALLKLQTPEGTKKIEMPN